MNKVRWLNPAAILLALIIIMGLSGCDLATKNYTIYLKLGHLNESDSKSINIWVSGMIPSEGGNDLSYNQFVPENSEYIKHTVALSNPKDFTVYVEAKGGYYSVHYEIKDGASYSFYYVASSEPYNHIMGTEIQN